ncbi:fluoride efflux transporter CrcB [Maritimibacter sp. 55A14]|uniref:fluoride efflux transporter CrcB n=1 Tax=Maritimibacter sp. 55A14 TaxID=2174844 RepID=UPI000D60A425|nr:fluoride efflux transporter CrcB [Maritimibacter sp. 55A14]PWE32721.1 fluoride efflux transporter CrcB [Maritimibacter sp. 55A14]
MLTTLLQVALGGAIGASLRYSVGVGIVRVFGFHSFPLGIITVNILGSFLMGVFVVVAANRGLTWLGPFIMTGMLGGFTTFSSFSLEAATLYERGDLVGTALYVGLSVACSILGLFLGMWLMRGAMA